MNLTSALLLIAGGVAAGFINTIAGSGSLITLPLLIFAGLPAPVANGSNRVAVLAQSLVAVLSFRGSGVLDIRKSLPLIIPASLGALLGAQIAVRMDEVLLRRAIGALMIAMLLITVLRARGWGAVAAHSRKPVNVGWQLVLFFANGVRRVHPSRCRRAALDGNSTCDSAGIGCRQRDEELDCAGVYGACARCVCL